MLESMVADWLTVRKIDFDFSENRQEWGGLKADFIVPEFNLVLRITDEEEVQEKAIIENWGYKVVDLKETDLKTNLNSTMTLALTGENI